MLLRQKLQPLEEGLKVAEKMADARQSTLPCKQGSMLKINDILTTKINKTY